jgi:hypothetical protein
MHKYTNTQIQIHKYKIHKYINAQMPSLLARVILDQRLHGLHTPIHRNDKPQAHHRPHHGLLEVAGGGGGLLGPDVGQVGVAGEQEDQEVAEDSSAEVQDELD